MTHRSRQQFLFQGVGRRKIVAQLSLRQAFITPYTPQQNGLIERFFRSLKEACTYQHTFGSFQGAKSAIARWLRRYNGERPHQGLGYRSPIQYRAQQERAVA